MPQNQLNAPTVRVYLTNQVDSLCEECWVDNTLWDKRYDLDQITREVLEGLTVEHGDRSKYAVPVQRPDERSVVMAAQEIAAKIKKICEWVEYSLSTEGNTEYLSKRFTSEKDYGYVARAPYRWVVDLPLFPLGTPDLIVYNITNSLLNEANRRNCKMLVSETPISKERVT